jgi:hypothetical protein
MGVEVSNALPFLPYHAMLLVRKTVDLFGRTQHGGHGAGDRRANIGVEVQNVFQNSTEETK